MISRIDFLGFLLAILLLVSLRDVQSQAEVGNAGVKVVLTHSALNYAAEQAVEVLARKVPQSQIGDLRGSANIAIGNVNYEITDTKISSFTKPSSNVAVNPGQGLTMSLSEGGVSADGNWRYQYKRGFIKLRDSGSFTASANGISISVSVILGASSDGAPTISATDCHCSIRDVSFRLHGGASWLYNIFLSFYKDKIRDSLESILCNEAKDALNNNGVSELATLNLQASINDILIINYRLAASPIFQNDFMETNHVGRFLNDYESENALAMQASTDRMLSVSISDVVFNSASRLLYRNNKFHFDETFATDILANIASVLEDGVEVEFNATTIGISIGALSAPKVTFRQGSLAVNAEAEARVDVLDAAGTRVNAILLKFSLDYEMRAEIQDTKIVGSVLNLTPRLTYCSLSIVDVEKINEAVVTLANLLIPSVDEALAKGLPLPNVAGVYFHDSVIHLNDGHITVATNAVYHG